MGKSKKGESSKAAKAATATTADATGFDPTLAALFASSSGPVTIPQKSPGTKKVSSAKPVADTDGILRTEANVDGDSEAGSDTTVSSSAESSTEDEHEHEREQSNERPRKRRKVDLNDDLESKYLSKLAKEEEQELKQRNKQQAPNAQDEDQEDSDTSDSDASDSDLNSDLQDISDSDAEPAESAGEDDEEEENNTLPQHESLDASAHDVEEEKTSRSVFLGNVSTACIKSKAAKKALIHHLQTAISPKHHEKIESLRFRSTAFVADAGPKRAAYAKKELMDETMHSTNAYVVLSSQAAARKVAAKLNGTVVLDRHLRADWLGSPAKVDHRRCVFVGNLSFVDEATAPEADGPGEGSKKRKRAKDPADVEEGLWRTFGKVGQVESVRVIRDKETRISKGFAYVQFTDENAVESALLMDGKKFPPMLPRLLRVSRAKKEMKRDKRAKLSNGSVPGKNIPAARRDKAGRGKAPRRGTNGTAAGERVVLEGNRASSGSLPKGLKKLKKRPAVKPTNRSSKRAAAFRAGGGKKKRDMAS